MAKVTVEREALIARYQSGPARLKAALATVPAEALQWRPAPGQWSAHEIVVHCADSEANAALRIRYLVAELDPLIVGYDQDEWARRLEYHDLPLEPALLTIEAVRANTVPLLRRLPEAAWAKVGRHTEDGSYSADRWLAIYAAHLEEHATQIEANVAAWRRGAG
jgi:DinB superfamily